MQVVTKRQAHSAETRWTKTCDAQYPAGFNQQLVCGSPSKVRFSQYWQRGKGVQKKTCMRRVRQWT